MKILIDECVPKPKAVKRELTGHEANSVPEMGWASKKNGELLALANTNEFDVFLTIDQNLQYQQNLQQYQRIAVIVLKTPSNLYEDVSPLLPQVREQLATIQAGDLIVLGT